MGGRRPKNSANLSPEEEEKRKVRRERNKLAAARCRKRRVDQTNDLMEKVLILETEKAKLQSDIQDLQTEKEDLEFLLSSHRAQCKIGGLEVCIERKPKFEFKEPSQSTEIGKIKEEVFDASFDDDRDAIVLPPPKRVLLTAANPVIGSIAAAVTSASANPATFIGKPSRPSSLAVPFTAPPSQALGLNKNVADMAGVQITTPSTGVMFNFDSLMDGRTGLTPGKNHRNPPHQNSLSSYQFY